MLKDMRRKVANAISPEKSHSYTFISELKLATAQESNRSYLKLVHKRYEKEHGRPAIDDAEAWKYDREVLNEINRELGHEEVSTEFIPSHFYEEGER